MMSDDILEGELLFILLMLEANRPFANLDEFGAWYRGKEASRTEDNAAYFYRDKIPLKSPSPSDDDTCEPAWLSDSGIGAERVYDSDESPDRKKLKSAEDKLRYRHKKYLIPVLRLIVKNVNNKEESICELMRNLTKPRRNSTIAAARNYLGFSLNQRPRRRESLADVVIKPKTSTE